MNILLEINPLGESEKTGIPYYLNFLCRSMLKQAPFHQWTLCGTDLHQDPLPRIRHKKFKGQTIFGRSELERIWEKSDLFGVPADVDLYHLPFPALPAPRLSSDTRFVATIYDLAFVHYPETVSNALFFRRLAKYLPEQAAQADHLIAISQSTKRDLIDIFDLPSEKITVVYPGNDIRSPHPDQRAAQDDALNALGLPPRYILCVGTWEPRKNLDTLFRAFHRLLPEFRRQGIMLCHAGSKGWKGERTQQLIEQLKLQDDIKTLGYVPRELLPRLYERSLFFVYPSLYEGFGMPVLEAISCGTPVITSNVSSLPEAGGEGALLVDPLSEDELANAMMRLIGDADLRKKLGERGLEYSRRFSWSEAARRTLAVYDAAVAGRQPQ